MKVYEFGQENKPVLVILPGTCSPWDLFVSLANRLTNTLCVAIVSYDGFDETENTTFISVLDEVEKIEDYINKKYRGKVCGIYGCSLGGTLMTMIAIRGKIHMDYGIVGSSDFDTNGKVVAKLKTKMVGAMIYPIIKTGKISGKFERIMDKEMSKNGDYLKELMKAYGIGKERSYIKKKSIENQFYTDLITKLPKNIEVQGTEFHIFYAKKMGEKYLKRYHKYFKNPIIHEDNLQHEELLMSYPEKWSIRIQEICRGVNGA